MCDDGAKETGAEDDQSNKASSPPLLPPTTDVWIKTEIDIGQNIKLEIEPTQSPSESEDDDDEMEDDEERADREGEAIFSQEDDHVKSETNPKLETDQYGKFPCKVCGRVYRRAYSLGRHMKRHEAPPPGKHQCQTCLRVFATHNYIRHIRVPCNATACPVCHKEFTQRWKLLSHMTKHTSEKPFKCDLCGNVFKHSSALARHKERHIGLPKLHACSVCGKSFSILTALEVHMRSHTHEKPFTCSVCMKAFSHKHNMLRHLQLHEKVVHLKCEVCQKEFPRESRLKYHMRVHWADNKPYKCGLCHKSYSHRQNITRHYRKKHPQVEYIAPNTDAEIANKGWELRMAQKQVIEEQKHKDYILPEIHSVDDQGHSSEDEVLVKPEVVIIDNVVVKQEI